MVPSLDIMVVQNRQIKKGKLQRKVTEVLEIAGKEGDVFGTNTLFKYDPKTGKIEEGILNGRIIHELSALTGYTISQIDQEIDRRKTIIDAMVEADLNQEKIYEIIQTYYEDYDKAIDMIHSIAAKNAKE